MKIAYFDCFSGISGDMCLGALVDAGVSLQKMKRELKKIPIRGYELHAKKVKRAGFVATKVDVIERAKSKEQRAESNNPPSPPLEKGGKGGFEQRAKRWKDIEKIINNSALSQEVKQKGLKVFKCLFEAEAKVHGEKFNNIHLHELGAVDCIVDVFGTIIGLGILGVKKVYSSPINLGGGSVKTNHGILPVPAPAAVSVLGGVPVYSTDVPFELTTPTGAAILKGLSAKFSGIPSMNIEKTGTGAGSKNFKDRPNVLRLFIGNLRDKNVPPIDRLLIGNPPIPPLEKGGKGGFEKGGQGDIIGKCGMGGFSDETITVIEANIDDMNPQVYEYVMEKLFKEGALDVFLTQILMKKGRPGIKLTVLSKGADRELLMKTILRETTTIGLRFYEVNRMVLQRETKLVDTEFGKVRVKFSRLGDEILKATPEYEDCRRIAKKLNMPLIEVMRRIKIPNQAN
ncbi:MAG: nickel pincer cofactor biosynthesis protein LarC [Nitrospirota bacterium]